MHKCKERYSLHIKIHIYLTVALITHSQYPRQHSPPSLTSYSRDEVVHPPSFFTAFRSACPPSPHPSLLPVSSIIHKLKASPCRRMLWVVMTVIAEEMGGHWSFHSVPVMGLKGSSIKWAPGCRSMEQNSRSVGAQRMDPECVSRQWEDKGL